MYVFSLSLFILVSVCVCVCVCVCVNSTPVYVFCVCVWFSEPSYQRKGLGLETVLLMMAYGMFSITQCSYY